MIYQAGDPTTYTEDSRHHQRNARLAVVEGFSHLVPADSDEEALASLAAEYGDRGQMFRFVRYIGEEAEGLWEVVTSAPVRRPFTVREARDLTIATATVER